MYCEILSETQTMLTSKTLDLFKSKYNFILDIFCTLRVQLFRNFLSKTSYQLILLVFVSLFLVVLMFFELFLLHLSDVYQLQSFYPTHGLTYLLSISLCIFEFEQHAVNVIRTSDTVRLPQLKNRWSGVQIYEESVVRKFDFQQLSYKSKPRSGYFCLATR